MLYTRERFFIHTTHVEAFSIALQVCAFLNCLFPIDTLTRVVRHVTGAEGSLSFLLHC